MFMKGNWWCQTSYWCTTENPCGLLSPVSRDATSAAGALVSLLFSGVKCDTAVCFMSYKYELPAGIAPLSALTSKGVQSYWYVWRTAYTYIFFDLMSLCCPLEIFSFSCIFCTRKSSSQLAVFNLTWMTNVDDANSSPRHVSSISLKHCSCMLQVFSQVSSDTLAFKGNLLYRECRVIGIPIATLGKCLYLSGICLLIQHETISLGEEKTLFHVLFFLIVLSRKMAQTMIILKFQICHILVLSFSCQSLAAGTFSKFRL